MDLLPFDTILMAWPHACKRRHDARCKNIDGNRTGQTDVLIGQTLIIAFPVRKVNRQRAWERGRHETLVGIQSEEPGKYSNSRYMYLCKQQCSGSKHLHRSSYVGRTLLSPFWTEARRVFQPCGSHLLIQAIVWPKSDVLLFFARKWNLYPIACTHYHAMTNTKSQCFAYVDVPILENTFVHITAEHYVYAWNADVCIVQD